MKHSASSIDHFAGAPTLARRSERTVKFDRTPVDSFDFALEARAQLALFRIAATAGNEDKAEQYLWDAEICARASGARACLEGADMSLLLAGEPSLIPHWDDGFEAEERGRVVWFGEWLNDMDGLNETRPSVSLTRDGYVPALEVSHRGGDCEPNAGHPRATLQEAIGAAKEMESRWHFDECID
ncbi:hypothetical protein KGP75_18490 [Burkholderia cenocepacia]|nr:hypothetical protein [Burkholderia orbicola]MBR8282655.1 hypothetical protein [Burkholderia vietnamiensis]MCO8325715.1 hypothetical protein [Burkholderia cenocepacia]MCO8332785.1 hypothetical protein [Burkholderia cenocepacia]MCO8340285.1 hypothetical protein [Burkholderia cenocepacia]